MKLIYRKGTTSFDKATKLLIKAAVLTAINHYHLQLVTVPVIVKLQKRNNFKARGCMYVDNQGVPHVLIYPGYTLEATIDAVFHEMTHVKQYLAGEYDFTQEVTAGYSYDTDPCELEAWEAGEKLSKKFLANY